MDDTNEGMAGRIKGVGSSVIALLACVSTVLGSGMGAAGANPLAALIGHHYGLGRGAVSRSPHRR